MVSQAYLVGVDVLAGDSVTAPDEVVQMAEVAIAELKAAEQPRLVERRRSLQSEIENVDDADWTDFVLAMKTQEPGAVSASNEMGMFGMKPRRLADLGLMRNLKGVRSPTDRMVWIGEWVPPFSEAKFLASPALQYQAFSESMRRYVAGIEVPEEMSLSGALAILHRCGPNGLRSWSGGERFPSTVALFERANDIF